MLEYFFSPLVQLSKRERERIQLSIRVDEETRGEEKRLAFLLPCLVETIWNGEKEHASEDSGDGKLYTVLTTV